MEMMTRWSWVLGFAGALLLMGGASAWYALGGVAGPPTTLWIMGAILVVLWVAFDRQGLVDTVSTRHFALSSGSFGLQILAAGLAIASYLIVEQRFDTTWDLTHGGAHSLSGQTLEVLHGLTEPLEMVAFFEEGDPQGLALSRLLPLYAEGSSEVSLTWVDPLSDPVRAQVDGIVGGTLLLRQGDREQRLEIDFSETNITRRMVLVQSSEEHKICWSRGHGEADPDGDVEPNGFGAIVLALEGVNYQVVHTSVANEGIPRDCEVLVVVRPRNDWLPWEREAFAAYIAEGGNAFLMLDPLANTPDFNADLGRFGLEVHDDVVFDADPSATFAGMEGTLSLYEDRVLSHPITRGLGAAVVLPVARSLGYTVTDGILVKELLRTSPNAWGETDLEDPDVGPTPGEDLTGQLNLALLAEVVDPDVLAIQLPEEEEEATEGPANGPAIDLTANPGRLVPADFEPKAGGKIVLIGDADFASNQVMTVGNNKDFFLNVLAWLVGEEEQLGERPKVGDPLDLTEFGSAVLCLVSVGFVPGTATLFALFTLLRRRRL